MKGYKINGVTGNILGLAVAAVITCLALQGTGWCTTYYVSNNGNDDNDGSMDQPFKTFSAAATRAQAGDLILIAEGVYQEMLDITRSGEADAPIVFQADQDADVRIDATGLRHGVIIWDADHIVVRNLTIENALGTGIHIHDHQDGHGADANRIEGNTIRQCGTEGYNGIYVGGHNNLVIDNHVINNGRKSTDSGNSGHGIYVLGNGNRIQRNTIQGNARTGIRLEGEKNIFEGNVIENNLEFGITIWVDAPMKGEGLEIRHNTLRNNQRGGISVYGQGDGEKPQNVLISSNAIVNENGEYGIRVIEGCRQVRVLNNTFQGAFSKAVLYVDDASLIGYEERDSHIEATGVFFFRNKTYPTYTDYKRAYWVDPVNLREVP